MDFLCTILFAFTFCKEDAPVIEPTPSPEPTPTPIVRSVNDDEPSDAEKQRTSSDGRSIWEWKYERMCRCQFVRSPMTPAQIAARDEQEASPDGRFIFIPNR